MRRVVGGLMIVVLCATGTLVQIARSQSTSPATEADNSDAAAGVILRFHPPDAPDRTVDARVARLVALAVPEGTSASPMLPPGPFRATFEGFINLKIRGSYTFTAHGAGGCEVTVNDKTVLRASGDDLASQTGEPVRLKKGSNAIVVKYASPASGPAALRLYWAERNQPAAPIPPTVLTRDVPDAQVSRHLKVRAGRELFAVLRCAKCHATKSAMPEAQIDAPSLAGIGSRLRSAWMARWIDRPMSLRPDASMPRVFNDARGGTIDPRALDITAYLETLKGPPVAINADAAPNGRLFTSLGCVACHTFEPEPAKSDHGRLSLARVVGKWHRDALVGYLLAPHEHYAWNPMPDFKLTRAEASQLAAYILSRSAEEPTPPVDLGNASAKRGEQLVVSSGCLNCHTMDDATTGVAPVTISNTAGGCLAVDAVARGTAPDFELTETQRASLLAMLDEPGNDPLKRDTPVDFADRQIASLNCVACHTLDAQTDTWSNLKPDVDAIDAASPPGDELVGDQSRPSLTWAGEKLHTEWMAKFIAGEIEEKPRPWLAARMPAFGPRARLLAEGMALHHGILPRSGADQEHEPIDPELAEVGRRLVGKEQGFSCVTCHAIGSTPAISPFEAFGPNFADTSARMRHDFYTRWVRNPQRYEPGTRMPQYADMDGKTSFRDVFDGDAARQFEAIWQYLRQGEQMQSPR